MPILKKEVTQMRKDLCFGTLCSCILENCSSEIITLDELKERRTQRHVLQIVYFVILGEDMWKIFPKTDGTISKIYNCSLEYNRNLRCKNLIDEITIAKLEDSIIKNIEDKSKFLAELIELARTIPNLKDDIMLFDSKMETDASKCQKDLALFLANCMAYSLTISNIEKPDEENDILYYKPFNRMSDDPHGRENLRSRSQALKIEISLPLSKEIFYHFECCNEFIINNGLKITALRCEFANIYIDAEPTFSKDGSKIILRRIEKEDWENVKCFIEQCNHEFKPKVAWKNRKLYNMAIDGLKSGKWLAYGYFDSYGNILSYVDTKIRLDGDCEIGIVLTENNSRRMGLATSLLYLCRIRYPGNKIYVGTFEENISMRSRFENTGFIPNEFHDIKTNYKSNKIRERYDPKYPMDLAHLTNSVYYIAESIHIETLRGVEAYDIY